MKKSDPFVLVLGIAQDGGYPHTGCFKKCCLKAWKNPSLKKNVTCIAIVDPLTKKKWIIDATPDFDEQLFMFGCTIPGDISGILLTHAHIGHYTGLMHLGKKAMNTKNLTVYAAPKMKKFLQTNLPWSKLIKNKNIKLIPISVSKPINLNKRIRVIPFIVPHRDEFSETLGFRIESLNSSAVFIPDIDSWDNWENKLIEIIRDSGRVYIDGTFYDSNELPKNRISKVPHPFISETIKLLNSLSRKEKNKVHFIHLNHTNPCINEGSKKRKTIKASGFHISEEMSRFYF